MNTTLLSQETLKELNINDLPKEIQNEIIARLGENIMKRVTMSILEQTPEPEREKLATEIESKDFEALYAHISKNIPDLDDIVSTRTLEVVNEFKNASVAEKKG